MSDLELLVNCIILSLVIGAVAGAALVDVLFAAPARKELDALRYANARRRRIEAEDRLGRALFGHPGTPYLPRPMPDDVAALVDEHMARPGLRIVNGASLYSADWLSDDTTEARA